MNRGVEGMNRGVEGMNRGVEWCRKGWVGGIKDRALVAARTFYNVCVCVLTSKSFQII